MNPVKHDKIAPPKWLAEHVNYMVIFHTIIRA